MKTLILNGSPRPNGNTVALINELKRHLEGEVIELSAFRSSIAPCVDCRGCWETARCVVRDDMDVIYGDDFDNVVIASPVYFSTLPGKMLSLISRMQPWHAATFFIKQPLVQRRKKSAAILTGGGKGNCANASHHLSAFFRMVNAHGFREHMVISAQTDTIPAWEDEAAIAGVREMAEWLNRGETP
jgi:multimeric flavodoxin WrbA